MGSIITWYGDRLHPFAIHSLDLNPGGFQTQARFVGNPPNARLNRRNHPHTQTELTGQYEPCSVPDDNYAPLMTQCEHNLLQVSLIAPAGNAPRHATFQLRSSG